MKSSFENKLKEKAYKVKIKPSDTLEHSILEEINLFSQKIARIRKIKQTTIIATSIISAAIIAWLILKPSTIQKTQVTNISQQIAKLHIQQHKTTILSHTHIIPKTENPINKNNNKIILKNGTTKKQKNDTILCSSEYVLDNNKSKTSWKSFQDNIIISNTYTHTTFLFAKPGYYKAFSYNTKGDVVDSVVFISLFVPQTHIYTCNNHYILSDIITKYTYIPKTQGIIKQNNSIVIQKGNNKRLQIPITFKYKSQIIVDTLFITFGKKPFINPQIIKIASGLYSVSFRHIPELQYFVNNNEINYSDTLPTGRYTIKIVNKKTKCDTSFIITLKEKQVLLPEFDYTALQKRAGIPFYFQNKTQATTKGKLYYKWNFGDNTYSNESSPTHIYERSGKYTVTLKVSDDKNNSASIQKTIVVLPPDKSSQPNVFTPNNDGKNDVFKVQLPYKVENFKCEIFTRDGKKVYELNDINSSWNGKINNSPAAEGIYYYIITGKTPDGKQFIEKNFLYLYR